MTKKYFRLVHLWLGIIVGLAVFVIAVTGSIYTFKTEIENLTQPYRFVPIQHTPTLLPSQLMALAQKALPLKHIHSISYFNNNQASQVLFYNKEPNYHYTIFINPYTGHIQHIQDEQKTFFYYVLQGHMYLWLPQDIGRIVVGTITVLFFIMVISGLILWWPHNLHTFKNRIQFIWTKQTNIKRKIWDLHSVTGFYTSLISFIFIITGLVWVFPVFAYFYYLAIGGEKSMFYKEPITQVTNYVTSQPMDVLYKLEIQKKPQFAVCEIHAPETDSSSVLIVTNSDYHTYYKNNYQYYNPYTLQELNVTHLWGKYQDAHTADKIIRMNYDLHVGAILGLPGKILVFLAGLCIAGLPITGLWIFLGKKRKK